MKNQVNKTIIVVLISFFMLNATSEKKNLTANLIEKNLVKISGTLYANKFEVSNWLYRQFLMDLASNNRSADLKIAQIDSTGWLSRPIYNEQLAITYHTSEKFEEYPVVNISYEAANLFCVWLTEKYNSFPDKKFKVANFILPSEQDWMLAAKGGNENSVYSSGNSLKSEKGMFMCNYKRAQTTITDNAPTDTDILAPAKSYWGNGFDIYNMSGNAAEMISIKGTSKGGSFKTTEDALKINAKGSYEKSACDIGFRYFVQITN